MIELSYLRLLGIVFGATLSIWAFLRFRKIEIQRLEFLLYNLMGIGLVIVCLNPDNVNHLAALFSLQDKNQGRLITLLILSNIAIWVLLFYERSKQVGKDVQFDKMVRTLSKQSFDQAYPDLKLPSIVVVIPAFNEEDCIGSVLDEIPHQISGHPVIGVVVDDGSTDSTVSMAKTSRHLVISNIINRGGGAALRLGYDLAMKHGAKIIVTMDADGQHLPQEMSRLVGPILDDEIDFVIGSRLKGYREKDSLIRLVGIFIFNSFINFLAGTKVSDCSNGYRAFRVASLQKLELRQDQFHTAELIIDATRRGIRIGEAPISVMKRSAGVSKKGKNLGYGLNFLKTILTTWFRKY